MPTFIPSAALPTSPAQPAASSGSRGRLGGDDGARSFGAVLERSRAGARQAQDSAEAASAEEASATPQKPGRHLGRKDEPGSELLTIALFAPQTLVTAPAAAATPAAGGSGTGATTLPATDAAVLKDASLAATAAAGSGTGSAGAADALPAANEGTGQDAKAPAAGRAVDTATTAGASAAPADKGFVLPTTLAPAASTEAIAQPAAAAASAAPLAGALPSAKTPSAGAATAAASADAKAAPASALAADVAKPAEAQAALPAAATDTEAASAPATSPTVFATATPMQPALDRAQPAASPAPAPTLSPPVGSAEWGPALGHQMLRMSAGGQQVAELNLNPAGLGPLKITLSVGDNQAQAMFVSSHESVRKAVEAALPQLRNTLAEQGISLGQTSVGAESRPWAGAGGFAQQQEQQRQPASANGVSYPGAARSESAVASLPARAPAPSRSSGVDTFA
ncbi:flagellar hook-length control protein FliK [Variovorax guangxiensis]|uniref:flagellar hook-length control protein FliK n=1 Tax=Variovorax guangxiensis TaxID=1775474 RepID=UPI00285FBEC5|nr:flagellar hook-length control protein FliK [Variovorax guangxiensis]MDR6860017.1 flagellar hook-length control protein FliK [Variovorax guangxiensis]